MRFITDYSRLNHQLVRNKYPLPRVGKKMQQLKVFQYATELDLNMGYYIISLSTKSQYMTAIVTEFGKFRYNRLPMGMCDSCDIFQATLDKLIGDIKDVKTYINNILLFKKRASIST